jgi:hypothetical protein
MWYSFDLVFLSSLFWNNGSKRLVDYVSIMKLTHSKRISEIFDDVNIYESGIYIFHNYHKIHYLGKTSRSFYQRFKERKNRKKIESEQKIWKIIESRKDFYILLPTHFSTQIESILLENGIRGEKQRQECSALIEFNKQQMVLKELLVFPWKTINNFVTAIKSYLWI